MKQVHTAVVKAVDPEDVIVAHLGGSADGDVWVRNGNDGWLSISRESVSVEGKQSSRSLRSNPELGSGSVLTAFLEVSRVHKQEVVLKGTWNCHHSLQRQGLNSKVSKTCTGK